MHNRILAKLKSEVSELEGTSRIRMNLESVESSKLSVKDHNTIIDATDFLKLAERRIQKVLVLKMLDHGLFSSEFVISEIENLIRRHTEYNVPNGWDSVTT